MPSIHKILTIIGHRFDHLLGLDESSGLNSTTILHGNAFPIYLVLRKKKHHHQLWLQIVVLDKNTFLPKGVFVFKKKTPAASLKRRKCCLGLPIHTKLLLILRNIRSCTILVLNEALYIDYIALAIGPFVGMAYRLRNRSVACCQPPPAQIF